MVSKWRSEITLLILLHIIGVVGAAPSFRDIGVNVNILPNTSKVNILSTQISKAGNCIIASASLMLISERLSETELYCKLLLETPKEIHSQTKTVVLSNFTATEVSFNLPFEDFSTGDYYYRFFVLDPVDLYIINQTGRLFAFSLNNLCVKYVEAIQSVEGVPLVRGKRTTFKIICSSTFPDAISVDVKLQLWGFNRYSYSFNITLVPGENCIYLHSEIPKAPDFYPCTEGYVNYSAVIDSENKIEETREDDNVCVRTHKVIVTPNLIIGFVPVVYEDDPPELRIDGVNYIEFLRYCEASSHFLIDTYPLPEDVIINFLPTFVAGKGWNWLRILRELHFTYYQSFSRIVGVVRKGWIRYHYQRLHVDQNVLGFSLPNCMAVLTEASSIETVAHEIGHTYELGEDYPDGYFVPSNSWPCAGAEGYWVRQRRLIPKYMLSTSGALNITLSFMHSSQAGVTYWVNKTDYEWLMSRLCASDPEVIALSGIIFSNGTALFETVTHLPNGIPDINIGTTGDFYIVLLDKDGIEIGRAGFNVSFHLDPTTTFFAFSVPWMEGTGRVQLRDGVDRVLSEKVFSENSPNVNIEWPGGGEVVRCGETYTIKWSAYDLDGDPLQYSIILLHQNSCIVLASHINATSFDYTFSNLEGGEYKICVMAFDGANCGVDITDIFTVSSFSIAALSSISIAAGGSEMVMLNVTSHGEFEGLVELDAISDSEYLTFEWPESSTCLLKPDQQCLLPMLLHANGLIEGKAYYVIISGKSGNIEARKMLYVNVFSRDVEVQNIRLPKSIQVVNKTITISVTILNKGNTVAIFPLTINYSINQDPFIMNKTLKLYPKELITLTVEFTPTLTGRYMFTASAMIEDANSANNYKTAYMYVIDAGADSSDGHSWWLYFPS